MTEASTLSVILPTYNHGRFLPRALNALLFQSRPADEIIVVDDGSTDDTADVLAGFAAKHQAIRVIRNDKNIGVIPTLARGLNAARGTYVYFGAADDYVMPGFFSAAIVALDKHPQAGMACGEMSLADGITGQLLGARPPVRPCLSAAFIGPEKFSRLLRYNDNFILTGASLLRRDATLQAGGFDEALSTFADGYLVRKVALAHGLYYLPQTCLTWNIFADSASRTSSTDISRARKIFAAINGRMIADPVFPKWYPQVFSNRWRFSLCRLALENLPVDRQILQAMGLSQPFESAYFDWTSKNFGRRFARLTILAWLWIKFRPLTLSGIVMTAIARRVGR